MNKRLKKLCCTALVLIRVFLMGSTAIAELKIHFIDVGQGDAILVQCDDAAMLVDAGAADAGTVVHNYLIQKAEVSTLDYVIATHEHDDHLGGMPDALSGLIVRQVYSNTSIPLSYWFNSIFSRIQGEAFLIERLTEETSFSLGEAAVTILCPLQTAESSNDLCLTVRIDYGSNSVLLAADLEGDGENYLLTQQAPLQADVLKVGHHGGNTSTSEQFFKAIHPTIAVISVGTGNKHGHPHKEVINLLEKNNVTIYRTDLFGTIILTSDGKEWTAEVSKAR